MIFHDVLPHSMLKCRVTAPRETVTSGGGVPLGARKDAGEHFEGLIKRGTMGHKRMILDLGHPIRIDQFEGSEFA